MDWLSPEQLLLLAIAVPLLLAGLGAWLLDPSPPASPHPDTIGHEAPERGALSRSSRQPSGRPPPNRSPSPDQVPPSGA